MVPSTWVPKALRLARSSVRRGLAILLSPRTIPLYLILLIVPFLGAQCTSQRETLKGTIKGTIYVIGNEPFTSLAVQPSDGKMYRISTTKDIHARLLKLQGKIVELEYSKVDTTKEGITFSVKQFTETSP